MPPLRKRISASLNDSGYVQIHKSFSGYGFSNVFIQVEMQTVHPLDYLQHRLYVRKLGLKFWKSFALGVGGKDSQNDRVGHNKNNNRNLFTITAALSAKE